MDREKHTKHKKKYGKNRKCMKRMLNQEKRIEKALSELTKIQKDSSDKQVVSVLESIKKELNYLV